ncbi:hypothetical protein MKW92_009491 [Papaver armeniacum]|nr:hypothetical protein MKW92_009491 [Papaver armeniacum]
MLRRGIKPDNYTYPFLLNSCATLSALKQGVEIHGRILRTGFLFHTPVSNALIDMYGKCNSLDQSRWVLGEDMSQAQRVFDHMPVRNAISWNGMIVGYVNGGDLSSARRIFDKMPEGNVVSWTTMLVGYAKSGYMDSARFLFDSMPERNIIAWTAMINGYAQNGRPSEALELFRGMEKARIKPEAVTMTGVISASAQLGGTELANWIGSYVDREGIERNEKILTALIDIHAKCGNMEEACRLFRGIPSPFVFSYSALITGLASHGHGFKALEIFQKMQAEASRAPPSILLASSFQQITVSGALGSMYHML